MWLGAYLDLLHHYWNHYSKQLHIVIITIIHSSQLASYLLILNNVGALSILIDTETFSKKENNSVQYT